MAMYEVVFNGTLGSEPMLTVLHYDITGSTDFQLFADAIRNEMLLGLNALLVPSAVYQGVTVREDIPGGVGIPYAFTDGQLSGGATAIDYYGLIAAIVRKLTNATTRPTQGRIFQGGIPEDHANSSGFLSTSFGNSLEAAWELLRVIEFDGAGEAVMNIKASNPTAPNTVPYNVVSSLAHNPRISTQKRRNWNT